MIKELTYAELRELSYMGANVLHEETVFLVMHMLYVHNGFKCTES